MWRIAPKSARVSGVPLLGKAGGQNHRRFDARTATTLKLGDAVLAPGPLDHEAALALIHRLKASAVFGSYRGMPPADTEALAGLMVKLSQFAFDHADDIAEVDLNPVIVHGKGDGVAVVDALIVKRAVQRAERRPAAE